MSGLTRLAKHLGTAVAALLVSAPATYLFGKLWWALYMWHLGISDPSELSEDYGGGFFLLLAMAVAFIIFFITASVATWRISQRLFPRPRS